MKYTIILLQLLIFWNVSIVIAQDRDRKDALNISKYKESTFRVGVNYTNDYVYAGRKDSVASPYITPYVSYLHKSGFFTRAALSYLIEQSENRIDLFNLLIGYRYNGEHLFGGLSTNVFFFNTKSYAIQSEINATANGYLGYDIGGFELSADVSTLIGKELDVMSGLELCKPIYADKDRLQINPTVYAMAGTQQYYSEYYIFRGSNSVSKSGRKGRGGSTYQPAPQPTIVVNESSSFKLLAVDLSIPIYYSINKVRFSFVPSFAIPLNPSKITIDQITSTEEIKNVFYYTLGMDLRL